MLGQKLDFLAYPQEQRYLLISIVCNVHVYTRDGCNSDDPETGNTYAVAIIEVISKPILRGLAELNYRK